VTAKLLLTVAEAAEALGLGKSKAYAEIAAGRLGSVTIGRARRVPVTELESYVRRLLEEQERA
jgi:excisionase family DNA binding protein